MGWTVYNSDGKILQSAELGDNAVTSAKIADGAIVNADINASAVIAYSKLAALADGNILVGNGSNVATSVNPSGDVNVVNDGTFSISTGVIVNADVNTSAAIALSKLAPTTASRLLVSDGSGVITPSSVTTANLTDLTDSGTTTLHSHSGSSGANVGLSNLSGVSVNASINMNNNTLLNIGASGNDLTATGLACYTNGARISARNVTNAGVSSVGDFGSVVVADNELFTFAISDGCFFIVQNGSAGTGACFFGQWASGTIEQISTSTAFEPSSTDNGRISVYTTSNNGNVTVQNRTGASKTIRCLILGPVTSATAPE